MTTNEDDKDDPRIHRTGEQQGRRRSKAGLKRDRQAREGASGGRPPVPDGLARPRS